MSVDISSAPIAETVTNFDIRNGISYVLFGQSLAAQTFKPFGDIHHQPLFGAAAMQLVLQRTVTRYIGFRL